MYAASKGHGDIVRMLLDDGGRVDRNLQDEEGFTALVWAANQGHGDIVRMLLDDWDRVDRKLQNTNGYTALILAAREGHTDVVRMVVDDNFVVQNIENTNGETAYVIAVLENQNDAALIELLETGGDAEDTRVQVTRLVAAGNVATYRRLADRLNLSFEARRKMFRRHVKREQPEGDQQIGILRENATEAILEAWGGISAEAQCLRKYFSVTFTQARAASNSQQQPATTKAQRRASTAKPRPDDSHKQLEIARDRAVRN